MYIANYLTLTRIMLIFPVLYLTTFQDSSSNWIALGLFVFAGITDHLDGFIARKTGTTSPLGGLLDLMADKLLICIPLLYFISFSSNELLLIPSLIIFSRELIITSLRQFMAEKLGSNPIKVSMIAKSKTTFQITAISFLIISPNFGDSFYTITFLLFWFAAYLSLHSLYDYVKNYKKLIK